MEPAGCDSRRTIIAVICRRPAEPIHGHLKGETRKAGFNYDNYICPLIPMHLTVEPAPVADVSCSATASADRNRGYVHSADENHPIRTDSALYYAIELSG